MIGIILKESLMGKSIYRTLANIELGDREYSGSILDIGGGKARASHYRFLNIAPSAHIQTVNVDSKANPDFLVDVTRERVPLDDNSQHVVFCFNTLEHLASWDTVLSETLRLLKPGGVFVGSIPFLVGVHADPHDYVRMTDEGLRKEFSAVGFENIVIKPVGRGPFTAAFAQVEFLFPFVFHALIVCIALFLDWILRAARPDLRLEQKYVLNYIFYCELE